MTNPLEELLQSREIILLDGATGTFLMNAGLTQGAPPEVWNVEHPERILEMHHAYVDAGAGLILTNTFGGSAYRLKLHNLENEVYCLNKAAAELARQVADSADHLVAVAGSIGPSGELFEPMGQMSFEGAIEAFAEQARGLHDGGVDVFWIETMSDLREVEAAVLGARNVSDKPICASMTFDTNGHTMMGVSPKEAMMAMKEWGLLAIGANCGNGPEEIEAVIHTMRQIDVTIPLIAKSNAGIPEWVNNELSYSGTPEVMGQYAHRVRSLGARLIGGCCGNSPLHVAAMALALSEPATTETIVPRGIAVGASADSPPRERRRRRRV